MRIELRRMSLAAACALLLAVGAQARQAPSDEPKIAQLREEIQLLLDDVPPAGATAQETSWRATLQSLRGDLRDLLLEKRGRLKGSLGNIRSRATISDSLRGHERVLDSELQQVNREIAELDRGGAPRVAPAPTSGAGDDPGDSGARPPARGEMVSDGPAGDDTAGDGRAAGGGARGRRPQPPARGQGADGEEEKESVFDEGVESITAEALAAAAPPAEVAGDPLPPAPCTAGEPAAGASDYESALCAIARRILFRRVTPQIRLEQSESEDLFKVLSVKLLQAAGEESYVSFITEAQERRTDQQLGASPSSRGTTSLVSKGGVPFAFAFAVENGAATQTQSDTTVTFRVNPAGALSLLNNNGFITGFRQTEDDALLKLLRKTSVGLTFDTTRGDQPGVFTGDRQQLSEINARVEFVNDRDPRHRKYRGAWERFVATRGVVFANQVWKTTRAVTTFGDRDGVDKFTDPALQAWLAQTNQLIAEAVKAAPQTPDGRVAAALGVIRAQAGKVPVGLVGDETVRAFTSYIREFKAYRDAKNQLLDEIATGNVFTFEYTNKREVNASDTSNFRFIAAKGREVMGGRMDFTANGSLTLFHQRPAPLTPGGSTPGRLRDFQFAGQVDVPFQVGELGQFVFWFSGRYERLLEDATTQLGTTVPGTKGDIAIGQFGLKIPIPGLGMDFPISFTFANRTELVKEREVRGNFGFTFNLDDILARLKPF